MPTATSRRPNRPTSCKHVCLLGLSALALLAQGCALTKVVTKPIDILTHEQAPAQGFCVSTTVAD